MKIDQYETHPAADVFPLMEGEAFNQLAEDIGANGLSEPIVRWWVEPEARVAALAYAHAREKYGDEASHGDGFPEAPEDHDPPWHFQILDGRNRLRACAVMGVEPTWEDYLGDDPLAFVLTHNLHRRHLDESQRAMVAARVANLKEGRPAKETPSIEGVSADKAAAMLNVGRATVERARAVVDRGVPELAAAVDSGKAAVSAAAEIARLPASEQKEIVARGEAEIVAKAAEIRRARTEERRAERMTNLAAISGKNAALDGSIGRFPVIYADPPWRYEHAESESRAIENQYPTMALDEIKALDVASVTTDDAVLFLWTTSPKLGEAFELLAAWGFSYRTCMVWDKERIGMGYWARQQHELLLIAAKGTPPTPAPEARPASVFRLKRDEKHSRKPHEFYGLIERMFPRLPKLELFCRTPQDGWTAWGNQSAEAAE